MNYKLSLNTLSLLDNLNISFYKAEIIDLDEILQLYLDRIKWFKEKNIKQWKKYLEHHPKEEFEHIIKNGYFFILKQSEKIIAGFELSTDSSYWEDEITPAYYIYKIVTKVGIKDVGNLIFNI